MPSPSDDLIEMRDQVADILLQSELPPMRRLAMIHALFDVPRPKRGRKPLGGEACRLNFCTEYQKARRTRLHDLKRCNACGQPNDRHPKTRCQACADKYSKPAKRAAMNKSIEA
jgi:hypothetical protein